jgi:hypothetical protein
MSRTFVTTVYTIDELTPEAKEKACDSMRAAGWADNEHGGEEAVESLQEAASALDFKTNSREWYGPIESCGDPREEQGYHTDPVVPMSGPRLAKWIRATYPDVFTVAKSTKYEKKGAETCCPFTGVCFDEAFLDPLRAFLERPNPSDDREWEDILNECVQSLERNLNVDNEYAYSSEALIESAEANGYEFTESGIWPKSGE